MELIGFRQRRGSSSWAAVSVIRGCQLHTRHRALHVEWHGAQGVQKLLCSLSNYEAITGHAGPELHIDELPALEASDQKSYRTREAGFGSG